MNLKMKKYADLIVSYLDNHIEIEKLHEDFNRAFFVEDFNEPDNDFLLLDKIQADIDATTQDDELIRLYPESYITENELKVILLAELSKMK